MRAHDGDANDRGNDEKGRNKDDELVDDVKSMSMGDIMSQMAAMGGMGDSDNEECPDADEDNDASDVGLDEHTLPLIKCNDPSITSLTVDWEEDEFSCSVDWGNNDNEGCIGENTRVKKLSIIGCYDDDGEVESTRKNFEAFCKGLARNRSIEHLEIDDCDLSSGALFSILSPFFENLRRLEISSCTMNVECTEMFASALEGCNNSSLERIELDCNEIDDEPAGELIAALNSRHCNLAKLSLLGNNIGRNGCGALGNLLQNPLCKLKELYLNRNSIDDECVTVLVHALANNTTLEKLDMSNNRSITAIGWQALSTCD